MVNFQPASHDPGIAIPGSQLAGLRFFHVIAKLIFSVFNRHAEILANQASPANRASPPHVIGPLVSSPRKGFIKSLFTLGSRTALGMFSKKGWTCWKKKVGAFKASSFNTKT